MANIKRRFEVHPYDGQDVDDKGKVTRTVYSYDEDKRQMVAKEVKQDAGFMVYNPSGSSVRIKDEEELNRLGFGSSPSLVDMDSGEEVGPSDISLRSHSERVTHRSKPKNFEASLATKE